MTSIKEKVAIAFGLSARPNVQGKGRQAQAPAKTKARIPGVPLDPSVRQQIINKIIVHEIMRA